MPIICLLPLPFKTINQNKIESRSYRDPNQELIYCPKCGGEIIQSIVKFCCHCGKELNNI
jgi:hypothetical protein